MIWDETTPLSAANLNGLEGRITAALNTVNDNREDIYDALVAMGVTPASDSFSDLLAAIGGVTHRLGETAATAISRSGTKIRLLASAGYRDGSSDYVTHTDANDIAANVKQGVTIRGQTGTFTSDANATAADIVAGKTAYVNGSKVTGTGKRQATGTSAAVWEDTGYARLEVRGLTFKPTNVSAYIGSYYSHIANNENAYPYWYVASGYTIYVTTAATLYSDGFKITIYRYGGPDIPANGTLTGTATWIAYE